MRYLVVLIALWAPVAAAQVPGFEHLTRISVTERANANHANLAVKMLLDTATVIADGAMRGDGYDLRFSSDCDGLELLPHYVAGGMNTPQTEIWVRVPNLQAGESVDVFMSYGNANAPNVSTATVFGTVHSATDAGAGPVTGGNSGGSPSTQRGFRFSPRQDILVLAFGKDTPSMRRRAR
jgi:hypothetical protein